MKPGFAKNWIGGNRKAKKLLGFLFSDTSEVEVTGQFKIHVDFLDRAGPSYYLMHGGSAAFYHYEEAEKGEILQAMPADGVFIDIGANIGLFSLFVARLFPRARVFAFEPHPRLHRCIQKTAHDAKLSHLEAHQACVSRADGQIQLLINSNDSGGHTTDASQIRDSEKQSELTVKAAALDRFVKDKNLGRIDVIKIDVQGAEWDVLLGAQESLRRFKPKILVEMDNHRVVNADSQVQSIQKLFSDIGYQVRRVSETQTQSISKMPDIALNEINRGYLQTNFVLEI